MKSVPFVFSRPAPFHSLPKVLKPVLRGQKATCKSLTCKTPRQSSFQRVISKSNFSALIAELVVALPCFASEASEVNGVGSGKIDLEAILMSIDDFFNRNPFFVAGCTFIWLIVIPIAEFYLSKCKPIPAIDAFRKLQGEPAAQLLDIRDEKTLATLGPPNLKILNKITVQIQFREGEDDEFVERVKEQFSDPMNTVLCVMDNFDGNSLKVAELLFKNGFKEAYAIKGGVRGKDGWLAIQENLLPPAVHMYTRKELEKTLQHLGVNGGLDKQTSSHDDVSSIDSTASQKYETVQNAQTLSRSCSPYPNYPDLKPPSPPTPSKPRR